MSQPTLTPVPGAETRRDHETGAPIVDIMTCGTCGRSWNDAASSQWTPVPAGRCPFEYEHRLPEKRYQITRTQVVKFTTWVQATSWEDAEAIARSACSLQWEEDSEYDTESIEWTGEEEDVPIPQWDRFDICQAYWLYAANHHGGQNSALYGKLTQLARIRFYWPTAKTEAESLTPNGRMIYDNLIARNHLQ